MDKDVNAIEHDNLTQGLRVLARLIVRRSMKDHIKQVKDIPQENENPESGEPID